MEVSETLKRRYLDQTNLASDTFLINCLYLGNQCDLNYKQSKNKRLTVELALIKMCYVNSTIEAAEASKKKLSTTVETPGTATPAVKTNTDQPAPKVAPAPVSNRPAAAQSKPIADKDSIVKKSTKLLSLDDITDNAHQKQRTNKNEADDAPITMAAMIREFNQESVNELWQLFADSIKDTRGGASALMNMYHPTVTDAATISLNMDSELQKTQFTQIMTSLKNFIYSHIGFHPDIQVQVVKTVETSAKFFTPNDKLKRLIELNPALMRFQKELGLDPDYD
jgi:DNA polymerase-3 subunit gamma/tau